MSQISAGGELDSLRRKCPPRASGRARASRTGDGAPAIRNFPLAEDVASKRSRHKVLFAAPAKPTPDTGVLPQSVHRASSTTDVETLALDNPHSRLELGYLPAGPSALM